MASRGGEKPSFGSDVRHELALLLPARPCCQLSELRGVLAASGGRVEGETVVLRLTLNTVVRKVVRLAKLLGEAPGGAGDQHFSRGHTHIRPTYRVSLAAIPGTSLRRLSGPPPAKPCCRRAFLRGAFIVCGAASVTGAGYHLELALPDGAGGDPGVAVEHVLRAMGLHPQRRSRRATQVVYLKGGEEIALLLAAMGASHAVLELENLRVLRGVRGQANRVANSETANLGRIVATGMRQVAAVNALESAGLLVDQPPAIQEVAAARLAMPGASLEQLAARLSISKSAVNQRLRRLSQAALRSREGGALRGP